MLLWYVVSLVAGLTAADGAGHYMYRVPLTQPVESLAFNPRYPRLLAFAAETVPAGYGRDGKPSKEASGRVGILQFGK
jgi:hypothetical protein